MLSKQEQSFDIQGAQETASKAASTDWHEALSSPPLKLGGLANERAKVKDLDREAVLSWLKRDSLSLREVKSILEFSERFPKLNQTLESNLTITVLNSQIRTPESDKLAALNSEKAGYMRGPLIDPVKMIDLTSSFEFQDIVRALRKMGIAAIGVIYPTDRFSTQFTWSIYWKPESK